MGCLRLFIDEQSLEPFSPVEARKTLDIFMKQMTCKMLVVAVTTASLCARADYLFTWDGNSNLFQGSFEVTDNEMHQTNQFFYSLSLTNSISITSPDGTNFQWGPGNSYYGSDFFGVGGSALTNSFSIGINNPQATPQGDYLSVEAYEYNHTIQETLTVPGQGNYILYSETGVWNITYIPEPSAAVLLAVGITVYGIRRKRWFSRRPR
jgi:hypothetical protein